MNTPRYRLWKSKRISEGLRASWVDPETDYGSPAWRENRSKTQLAMYADPKKGPAVREKLSKTMTAKYADPTKGPAEREKKSKAQLAIYADPKKGPAAREKQSKTVAALYADPKKGPAAREKQSKNKLAMYADPKKGPAAREKLSRNRLALFADPKKGPAVRANISMRQYGPAGPPGETKDEKRARVEGLLERVKQRAMMAQTSPGNINWPEEDDLLIIKHVQTFGDINFAALAERFGGRHLGSTCKSRWALNLDPDGPRKNRFGRCEICARAKKGYCGTDRAHSKCLKLKQNGGDGDRVQFRPPKS